jgi:hypothetical protein
MHYGVNNQVIMGTSLVGLNKINSFMTIVGSAKNGVSLGCNSSTNYVYYGHVYLDNGRGQPTTLGLITINSIDGISPASIEYGGLKSIHIQLNYSAPSDMMVTGSNVDRLYITSGSSSDTFTIGDMVNYENNTICSSIIVDGANQADDYTVWTAGSGTSAIFINDSSIDPGDENSLTIQVR